MALAINLLFDAETSAAVEGIWTALAEAGVSRDMLDLDYPPHVTLVVVDDEALAPQLSASLKLGIGLRQMPTMIGPVRQFDETTICWLACVAAPALHQLHDAVCAAVPLEAIRPHYRPGLWTPHMTLQIDGNSETARAVASAIWPEPRPARAIRLDMASFVPVVRLGGVDLETVA